MTEALTPRWQEADDAVESLVESLVAAAARTADRSGRKRPRGHARPKNTRRHIAEVIRSQRLAPGLRVDRNMVAALLIGHRDLVTNPVLVVAVAQACDIIAGRKLSAKRSARMRSASIHVGELIERAEADVRRVPLPAPRVDAVPQVNEVLWAEAGLRAGTGSQVETGPQVETGSRVEAVPHIAEVTPRVVVESLAEPPVEGVRPPVPVLAEVVPQQAAARVVKRRRYAYRWVLAAAVLMLALIALLIFG